MARSPQLEAVLQRAQKVQNVLNLRRAERVEVVDHGVGFRATVLLAGIATALALTGAAETVVSDGLQQVRRASVVQEKQTLTDAPQRSRAELIRPGRALVDTVRQFRAHMMEREIRVGLVGYSAHAGEARRRCGQRG